LPHGSTARMLRLLTLALALPALCLADDHGSAADQMMQLMNMMNQMKGWGPAQQPQQHWTEAKTNEDYEAYLKWCEENRMRQAEQEKQMALLKEYRAKEAARAEEAKKAAIAKEQEEQRNNYMVQWKHWERQLQMVEDLMPLQAKLEEMEMKYKKRVLFSFLPLCRCNDYGMDISRFFDDEGLIAKYSGEIMNVDDLLPNLTAAQLADARFVAGELNKLDAVAQVKFEFGYLREKMCAAARGYYNQIVAWEKEKNFLEPLLPSF